MTPNPDWQDGEVVSFAAPLWIIAGVVLVFTIVGVVSTLNALTSPPPVVQCQRECCLREEDADALDSASVVVHPATRLDPR